MENPIRMDDLGVPPFQETSIYLQPLHFHRGAIHLRRWSRWTWRENSRRSHLSTTKMRRPIGFHNVKRDLKQPIRVSQCSELGFTNIFYNIIYGCFTMLTKNNKKISKKYVIQPSQRAFLDSEMTWHRVKTWFVYIYIYIWIYMDIYGYIYGMVITPPLRITRKWLY